MPNIGKSEMKRLIAAMKSGKFAAPLAASDSTRPPTSRKRRAAAAMVESVLNKAGLDLSKIDRIVSEDQKASRAAFDKQQAAAARNYGVSNAAFQSGMAARSQALKLLGTPFAASFATLDKPFLIWQLPDPQLDIFIDSRIQSMNSAVDVLVNIIDGSNSTRFVFFFLWQNESDDFVAANVASSLIVNGACRVQARAGIFSGHDASLSVTAFLTIMRWSGWGTDPATGKSNDQTPHPNFQPAHHQQVTFLEANGGHIFEGADVESQAFSFQPFPLSHRLLVVPGKAVVIFQVALGFSYGFGDGGDLQDNIFVDFSSNGNTVVCPNVELEILTPLSKLAGGLIA